MPEASLLRGFWRRVNKTRGAVIGSRRKLLLAMADANPSSSRLQALPRVVTSSVLYTCTTAVAL